MKKILFLTLLFLFYTNFSYAGKDEEVCFEKTTKYEQIEGIRPYILSTIALVESGRGDSEHTLGRYPWPWTVMAEGKGRFFENKDEAVKEVKKLQEKGLKNIDIGCMQVNVGFHGENFKSVEEMFDPEKNVEYAAKFVKKLYDETGFWGEAATRYHSKTTKKAERYEAKLVEAFSVIKNYILDGNSLSKDAAKKIANATSKDKKSQITNNISTRPTKTASKVSLKTPSLREKLGAKLKSSSVSAAFNANLYREQKKAEYEMKKQQRNISKNNSNNKGT